MSTVTFLGGPLDGQALPLHAGAPPRGTQVITESLDSLTLVVGWSYHWQSPGVFVARVGEVINSHTRETWNCEEELGPTWESHAVQRLLSYAEKALESPARSGDWASHRLPEGPPLCQDG